MNHSFPSTFQFERTREIRASVYRQGRLAARGRILDGGAGEGLIAAEMAARTGRTVEALDRTSLPYRQPGVRFLRGDAEALPFKDGAFDAVCYHFVLLWLREPVNALREAKRVLAPGGALLILSEPDLTSRIDEPDTGLGSAIVRSVETSGGHPAAGRQAGDWMREAGFRPALEVTGVEWAALQDPAEAEHELAFLHERGILDPAQVRAMAEAEREAAKFGIRKVLLPLTYGVGFKDA